MKFIQPKLGILGGGQLGRMLLPSTNYYDISTAVLDPNPNASCAGLVDRFVEGDFTHFDDVLAFGRTVDLLTIEIEHVNVEALYQLEKEGVVVYPQPHVVETIQDKRKQKQFYKANNIPTSPFVLVNNKKEVKEQLDFFPVFQKLGKGGYDGAGVQRLASEQDVEKAFDAPSLLEKAIDCDKEIAIIAARNRAGQVELFPPVEMVFHPEHNLVDFLYAPTELSKEVLHKAKAIVHQVVEAFELVGLLAVELFVTKDGEVLVNECAPRTHNSGHHSIHACNVSQFEQHLRSILNLPLAKIELLKPAAMVNLLGKPNETGDAVVYGLQEALTIEGVNVVFYGKQQTRPHRKMGHATITGSNREEIIEKVNQIKEIIKIGI